MSAGLKLGETLGEDPAGRLRRALQAEQPVLVVMLPKALDRKPDTLVRIEEELRRAKEIFAPELIPVRGLAMSHGSKLVVYDDCPGKSLAARLKGGAPISRRQAFLWTRQLTLGLRASARAGLYWGRISEDAIIIGEDQQLRLLGIGTGPAACALAQALAASYDESPVAPELIAGQPPNERTDIYALGLILGHLLAASPSGSGSGDNLPFDRSDWDAATEPSELSATRLVHSMTALDPGARLCDLRAVLRAIDCILDGKRWRPPAPSGRWGAMDPGKSRQDSPETKPQRHAKTLLPALALGAILLILGASYLATDQEPPEPNTRDTKQTAKGTLISPSSLLVRLRFTRFGPRIDRLERLEHRPYRLGQTIANGNRGLTLRGSHEQVLFTGRFGVSDFCKLSGPGHQRDHQIGHSRVSHETLVELTLPALSGLTSLGISKDRQSPVFLDLASWLER